MGRFTKCGDQRDNKTTKSFPTALPGLLDILSPDHRLEDFLKELPVAIKRAEPSLTEFFGTAVPLERRLKLRELQTSFVYTTVLAKKSKVGLTHQQLCHWKPCLKHGTTLSNRVPCSHHRC